MGYLRFLGNRRIGGIVIPFTGPDRKDSFGNFWTPATDFAHQRYSVRPLYYQHRGNIVEAGLIQPVDVRVTEAGVYMEVDLLENDAGNACLRLIQSGMGHYSTGCMPGSWVEAPDGWIVRWPWVECSVTDRPATRFGLTRADFVRSFLSLDFPMEGEMSEMFLRRGPVFGDEFSLPVGAWGDGELPPAPPVPAAPGNGASPSAPAPAPAPVAPAAPAVSDEQLVRALRQVMGEQPQRQLAPAPLPEALRPALPGPARIQLSHRFDDVTLAGLTLWGMLNLKAGRLKGAAETEFMRALRVKVEKQRARDEQISDSMLMRGAVRMVDSQVIEDWGRHIRADEAMTSTYDGYGDQLVPTLMSSVLWYHFLVESKIAGLLPRIQLPSVPFDYPIITGGPVIRRIPQLEDQANFSVHASVLPASKISTSKVTFSPGEIGALVLAEQTLFEDAGFAIADMWATQMMRQMARAIDDVLLNGDESAGATNISHFGTDPTATAYDKILILEGLRAMAVADSATVAIATVASTNTTTLRAKMGARGKFGLQPKGCVNVVDPGTYYKLIDLTDIDAIADVGEYATLLTGAVGQIKGMPVVVTDELENTNASGQVEDSHDGTKGSQLVIRPAGLVFGYARGVTTELQKLAGVGGYFADITTRFDLQEMEAGQVAYGYNSTI